MEFKKGNRSYIFQIKIIALLCVFISLILIPGIPIQLNPSTSSFILNVRFYFPNGAALTIENEATSRFEQVFSKLKYLEEITSISRTGEGNIKLKFDNYADLEKVRLELASLIRQVYPKFRDKISYPEINQEGGSFQEKQNLLTYTFSSSLPHSKIELLIKQYIIQPLSALNGIEKMELSGIEQPILQIIIKESLIQQLDINYQQISSVIKSHFEIQDLGWSNNSSGKKIYLQFGEGKNSKSFIPDLKNLIISYKNRLPIFLRDIATFQIEKQHPKSYYRINGKSGINLLIYSKDDQNQLQLAKTVKKEIDFLKNAFPEEVKINLRSDSTAFLGKELSKIFNRVITAFGILFFMIFIIYPSYYLFAVFSGFLVSLSLSIIVYYLFNLQLHSYSLASLTLSLGIVLDNIIIMTDHVLRKKNKKIIIAILAANLTTVGVFLTIFLIDAKYRQELTDFISVFSINLLMSLVVALWLIPALLYDKIVSGVSKYQRRRKSFAIRLSRFYRNYIVWIQRRRIAILLLLAVLFGLPFFALPPFIQSNTYAAQLYNQSFGSKTFQRNVKPIIERYLGGTLGLFIRNKDKISFTPQEQEQIKLYLQASLPYGSSLEQMNEVMKDFENFLNQFTEISRFQTYISGYDNGRIEIEFHENCLKTGFPWHLKGLLQAKARKTGSAGFLIFGVGSIFNDSNNVNGISQHLKLSGYNYHQLMEIANREKERLLSHIRIEKVLISSRINWLEPKEKYFALEFESPDIILQKGLNFSTIGRQILTLAPQKDAFYIPAPDGTGVMVSLLSDRARQNYFWEARETPIFQDSFRIYKNKNLTTLKESKGIDEVYRKNQEYQILLEYEFMGNAYLAEKDKKQRIKDIQKTLPTGFQIEDEQFTWWDENAFKKVPLLILSAIIIIFAICAILFDSIKWSFIPLLLIPLSYIGIFLCVGLIKFKFDQGGMAAFLLIAGLAVNGAIFIINDYLNIASAKAYPRLSLLECYLKSFNGKIIPILLTALSTCLGLLPFLIFDDGQPFWYALAVSTIFGTIFSVLSLGLFLPIFVLGRTNTFSKNEK